MARVPCRLCRSCSHGAVTAFRLAELMRSQDVLDWETNSLSLRERARVRGTAAYNCQRLGALPGVELCVPALRMADFIFSPQAHWFAERFFPLTPALSPLVPRRERATDAGRSNA